MSEKPSSNQNVFEPPTGRCLPATARADKCDVCRFENTLPDGSCAKEGMTLSFIMYKMLGLTSVMCASSRIRCLMALVKRV